MRGFFGLSDAHMKHVHDQIFYLVHHGRWDYFDVYDLPIKIRHWFVERLSKHFKDKNEQMEKDAKKSH